MDDDANRHLFSRTFGFLFMGGALGAVVIALVSGSGSLFS
jgi:hypothetical protein